MRTLLRPGDKLRKVDVVGVVAVVVEDVVVVAVVAVVLGKEHELLEDDEDSLYSCLSRIALVSIIQIKISMLYKSLNRNISFSNKVVFTQRYSTLDFQKSNS